MMNHEDEEDDGNRFEMAMEMSDDDENLATPPMLEQGAKGGINTLPMPIFENGRFQNPWRTWRRPKVSNIFRLLFCTKDDGKIPRKNVLERMLPVLKPNLLEFRSMPISGVRHLWIGHSTSLVQFDGVTLITDPMFSERCSPVQFLGVKRFRPVPCTVDELPHLDFVLISHTHYDHLDCGSVMSLNQKFGETLRWYVPMGLKEWMNDCGCMNVVEMTWWQEDVFDDNTNIKVVCTPCQHWGKRTTHDENKVLWCSWCVIGPRHSFYFSGDTAYCKVFKQIGRRLGPFTLATIPIGAYSPRNIMSNMHVDPEHAVCIHEDLRSQASIGIHWGTFSIASEPFMEPKELLAAEVQRRNMKPSSFFTVNHGEITIVGSDDLYELD
ncbi:unnamed protein product [Lymnaea stagnalis]|uniref:N-acetylphosphatidylethanolamine-hydrolyzing phospholipase D n=1 Tax=Lymnaea stagnalis TaxID=6523 RepID=A0AAV2HVQ6_LYMST